MARHNFGSGEYKYLRYPLPEPVAALRGRSIRNLAPLANDWHRRLRLEPRFPPISTPISRAVTMPGSAARRR